MSTLEKTIEIAARAHSGQVDKAGAPYILHPLRLMFAVSGENERIVAVLHDVVEDTETTLEDLREQGFGQVIIDSVDALTKRADETRVEAAVRASENPMARAVKIADVEDNMNIERISNPTARDYSRQKEYEETIALLRAKTKKLIELQGSNK